MGDWNRVHRACKEALNIEVNDMFEVSEVIEKLASDKEALQQQLTLTDVSHRRELLNALADEFNNSTHTYVGQPLIEKTLKAFNCG
jgi:hypothetical protein